MLRAVRLLLVSVLVAAVPVQALAAMATGLCKAAGHETSHSHNGHASPLHQHGGDDHHAHDGPLGDDLNRGGPTADHCGPCAACCASAAMPSRAALSPVFHPAAAPLATTLLGLAAGQPDPHYRPPLVG